jgi:hypothetical protein
MRRIDAVQLFESGCKTISRPLKIVQKSYGVKRPQKKKKKNRTKK